jgi:hypothetical protein
MRTFQLLDTTKVDPDSGSFQVYSAKDADNAPHLSFRREGIYITISASYGPLELALRPRYEDLTRTLSRLTVIEGLNTSRQVGTGQAYLAMGLAQNESLILRLTIVADATGHMSINLEVTGEARKALFEWLEITH